MPDLADRISHAAVAALDLAPFDDRFGRLSRQVLAGGATRFQRVTADDQAVQFVIPVGLAGQRIDYGALVLQDRQAGVLWRDAHGIDHAIVVRRSDASASFEPITLGGEEWLRFDVEGPGETLAFLVPPVDGQLLGRTLIDFFRASPGQASGRAVPEMDPEPAPAVRFPDPESEPEPVEPQPGLEADTVETTAVLPAVDDGPVGDGAADETTLLPADDPVAALAAAAEPALAATVIPAGKPLAPQEQFAVPPADLSQWESPSDEETRLHRPVPASEETRVQAPFDLYRDEQPTTPQAEPPAWASASTQHVPAQPPVHQQATHEQWDQSSLDATVRRTEAAPAYAQPSGTSRTFVGFLLGLLGTLAIGGAVIIVQLLG